MAENLPRYAVTDLIARVSGMSRGRLEMRLLGECAEVSRFMPPQTAGEGDMAFLTNAAYAEAMKASRASLLIMREQDVEALFGSDEPGRAVLVCDNPYAFFAFASQILFHVETPAGIHPRAFVEEGAEVDPSATVEALAVVRGKDESTLDTIHEDLRHQIMDCKDMTKTDTSTDFMDIFNRMPRFLGKFIVWLLTRLDIHGWIPASIIETDPYYCTVVISNLGSIKLHSGYHHLTNWGTCSVFCIIGEKSLRPVFQPDGSYVMHEMLDLGLTIDERLADGYYYSKTIRLLRTLLENPELLETPANQEIEY